MLKQINFPMLLLAILVVLMFCLVGVAISYHNYILMVVFLLLGFALMGFGLKLKKSRNT